MLDRINRINRINRIFAEDRDQWAEVRKSRGWGFGAWDLENHAVTTEIRFN